MYVYRRKGNIHRKTVTVLMQQFCDNTRGPKFNVYE